MFGVFRYVRIGGFLAVLALLMISALGTAQPVAAQSTGYGVRTTTAPSPKLASKAELLARMGGCQNATSTGAFPAVATPTPTLVTTITAEHASGTAITNGGSVTADKFPYKVTYIITVTNTGADMTAPATVAVAAFDYFDAFDYGFELKYRFLGLPKLASGASKSYTLTVNFGGATFPYLIAVADYYCAINADHTNVGQAFVFSLYAPNVDMIPFAILPKIVGNTQVGDGFNPGDKITIGFDIANFGKANPTEPMTVLVASPLIGKPIPITIAAADLPTTGKAKFYTITDMGSDAQFTIKSVKKTTLVPITVIANTTRSLPEDSKRNNISRTKVLIVPEGINLYGKAYIKNLACPQPTGETTFTLSVNNGGTQDAGAFSVQLLIDGKPAGAPQTINSLAAGSNVTLTVTANVAKQGFHTIGISVDTGKVVAEYNEKDNINKGTKSFFLTPAV